MRIKKGIKKAFEEFGKHLLNVGVAVIVFAILQPIIKGKFDKETSIVFGLIYVTIAVISSVLIVIGGSEDE
ncbi:MAG: hypothetical protein DSY47_06105 [Hydrogenothermus sp.]|nr:MAG: hypothetical protein DSY47_06105 [Hydrogenothermus sp.]